MTCRAVARTTSTLLASLLFGGLCVGAASAQPAPATVEEAILKVADGVCRPAVDTQSDPSGFAVEAGYSPEKDPPKNLPVGTGALRTWRAPSPAGRLYVMSGLYPEATTPSTCLIALYGAKAPNIVPQMAAYLAGLHRGFEVNDLYDITTETMHLTRYDRREGDTIHSVMIADTINPAPDVPTEVLVVTVVNYGWMLHPKRK
jgi:hypothetical protein